VDYLANNPSLKAMLTHAMEKAYRRVRRNARIETSLTESVFPMDCPWTFEQAMPERLEA
jgi:hypothetical protein